MIPPYESDYVGICNGDVISMKNDSLEIHIFCSFEFLFFRIDAIR